MLDCTQVLEQLLRFNRFLTLSQTEECLIGLHYFLGIELKKMNTLWFHHEDAQFSHIGLTKLRNYLTTLPQRW